MNRKLLCVGIFLFLFCSSITPFAYAQEIAAGVKIGDSFAYDFSANFRPYTANATIPPLLVEYNLTEWVRFTITDVANSTLSFSIVTHLSNGTEYSSQSYEDISTGEGGFPIIRANVTANELLYPSMQFSPSINETLIRTYSQGQRTVLRVAWNQTDETESDYLDAYFDQKTGMPVEFHVIFPASPEGDAEYIYTLIDSNIWTVPEFPPAIVLPLVAASMLAAALFYKKAAKRPKTT